MKKGLFELAIYGLLASVSLMGPTVLAQAGPPVVPVATCTDFACIINKVCGIFGYLFVILIVLAVIFVLFAAFKYLTAGGEQEKVSEANKQLIYAAVAVAVALLAKGLPLIVGGIMGSTGDASLRVCG